MKRKIYISMASASIVVMLLMAVASLRIYYGFFESQFKSDMRIEANLIKQGYENAKDSFVFLDEIRGLKKDIRVSIIKSDGTVSFDTHADANSLGKHLDRPEIQSAILNGYGEDVRYSKTLGQNTYYYALKLSDDNIVRLSNNTQSIMSVIMAVLPLVVLLVVIILIVCLIIARMLTNMVVKPLVKLGDNLDDLSDDANYDELNPFVEKIAKQNATITNQLQKLTNERDTITMIMDNMQEGLVVLGKDRHILSVNKSALSFLNSHKMNFVGQNFIVLTREVALISSIDDALSGNANDGVIKISGKSYHYFSNPVYEKEMISGAIMLLLDVTQSQKVEKMRQEFSANVSHELKTPLTTISGFAEMIQNDMVQSKEDLAHFASTIYKEASRLLFLIDDIMRLSQIEEHIETKTEQVNLFAVAQSVCSSLKLKADSRNIALKLEGGTAIITGNSSMLEELIYNLTDNAIKYNKENGEVCINVKLEGKTSVLTVSDTGIGIPQKHHHRIFERFYRVDKSRSKLTGGTGLGLAIAKHITEYHNGKIEFSSEENKGTTITVRI